jgi:hypothetical protein
MTGLPDKILKGDHQRIILAKLESMIGPLIQESFHNLYTQVWTQKCAVEKASVDVNISYY